MADVRINALATTATSAASDDYLALDGSANGTRKILATNVAQNVTDVTFGTSGPSAKSSIAARAARQGLGYSGIAGANVTASVAAYGTAAFTNAVTFSVDSLSAQQTVLDSNNGILVFITTAGSLQVYNRVGAAYLYQSASGLIVAGQINQFVYSRGSVYLNGVLLQGSISDTSNYTGTTVYFGGDYASGTPLLGKIYGPPLIYNRALTAAEVVSLYEAGAPAGADYNSASNTSIITGDNSTFASDTGYWSKSGGTTIGSGSAVIAAGGYIVKTALLTANKKYRAVVVATAGGDVKLNFGGNDTLIGTGAGTYTYEFTAVGTTTAQFGIVSTAGCTIDTVTLFALGLLLAPDAAQAGGGLVWYDTSGNAANITLPASGVSWNVPSSRYLGGNWNAVGTFNVKAATNLNWFQTTGTAGAAVSLRALNDAQSAFVLGEIEASTLRLNSASGGNVLLGTTTDSGNGRIQLASHTTSAGGIGFGTDTSLYRNAAQSLQLDGASAPTLSLSVGGTQKGRFEIYSEDLYISTLTAGKSLILRSGNATTALTLDSSQRCILAGALRLNNAYTAGAPTATGYVTLQDSAGNTYKVLVGT